MLANIQFPSSWNPEFDEEIEEELLMMNTLKKESKKINELFWINFDILKVNHNIPKIEVYNEAYEFAKEGKTIARN